MADNRYDYCLGTANSGLRKTVNLMLIKGGFFSSGEGKNIPELLRMLRLTQPWLAIIDTQLLPGNIKQLASIIEEDTLSASLYINTGSTNINGYMLLQWPVDGPVLIAVAEALCLEFARKIKLQQKIKGLEYKLSRRNEIDKAKDILINKMSLNEENAYRYLQKISMDHRVSMTEMATRIINNPGCLSALSQLR